MPRAVADGRLIRGIRAVIAHHAIFAFTRSAGIDALTADAPDMVVTCTSGDPRITHKLLNGTQPGDLLRVTGTLVQPPAPGENARLTADALEILNTALIPVLRDMVLGRYGGYCVIFDADRG